LSAGNAENANNAEKDNSVGGAGVR
jgi:hypothetical protein